MSDGGEVLLCDLEPTLGVLEGGRQGPTSGMEEPLMPDAGFRQCKGACHLFVLGGIRMGTGHPWSMWSSGLFCGLKVDGVVVTLSPSSQGTDGELGVFVSVWFIDM
mgnify:CR=1 FL=1